jgi:hypothetical protein
MTDRDTILDTGEVGYLDLAGAVTSSLCGLHCALMPALAAILPMIGLGLLAGEATETALLGHPPRRRRSASASASDGTDPAAPWPWSRWG